ncbi:MAG: substrate-binding domain-containing protein [Lachnospiraceae bacterium]|nr:substrate-binding domain-containing protein [Lachnospiraceae bacterium]
MNQEAGKKPKYEIITDDILTRIRNNDFSYDTVLCTEMQLTEQYGVSRITAKRALTDLEQRGILYRKRGVGSFVARNALNNLNNQHQPSSSSKMVSFLLPFDITKGGMLQTIKTVNGALNDNGYLMSIYISNTSAAKEKANIQLLLSQNISGLVYYPFRDNINLNMLNEFVYAKIPVVVIDKSTDCPYIQNVISDNFEGGRLLTEHLINLGHKNIGFLTTAPVEETSTVRNRFGGYLQQLISAGLTPDPANIICTPYEVTEEDIESENSRFRNAVHRMYINGATALLTENDRVAQLAICACRKLNLRVPEDISICGFDDQEIATEYDITSVRQDFTGIGQRISELMLASIKEPSCGGKKVTVPVELVIRGSTGAPKQPLL